MMYLDPLKLFPLLLAFFLSPALTWTNRAKQGRIRSVVRYLGFSFAAFALYRGLDFLRILELTSILAASGAVQLIIFRGKRNTHQVELPENKTRKIIKAKENRSYRYLRRRDHSLFEPVSLMRSRRQPEKNRYIFLKLLHPCCSCCRSLFHSALKRYIHPCRPQNLQVSGLPTGHRFIPWRTAVTAGAFQTCPRCWPQRCFRKVSCTGQSSVCRCPAKNSV